MTETDNTKLTELLKVKVETASDEPLQMLREELKKLQLLMPIDITSIINLHKNYKKGDEIQMDRPLHFNLKKFN